MTDIKVGDTVQQTLQVEGVVRAVNRRGSFELDNGQWYDDVFSTNRFPYVGTKVLQRAAPPKPTVVGTLVKYTGQFGTEFLYSLHEDGKLCSLNGVGGVTWEILVGGPGTTEVVHVPGDSDE